MVAAVEQRKLDVQQRIAGQCSFTHAVPKRLFDRRPVLARNVAAGDLRIENVTAVGFARLDRVIDLRILSRAAGLLLVGVAIVDRFRDRFAISHLRLPNDHLNSMRAPQDVDLDVQV